MPYTLSHIAAVVPFSLPLARLRILSAAVIGSIVPDFGYLMPTHPPRFETHGMFALVTFCLPVGLLTYWIFQYLMKTPLLSVLPDATYTRWQPHAAPASWRSLRQWLYAAGGVLVGALTHLAWDGFTHEDGRGVRMVPELGDTLMVVHGHMVTGALLLQGLSSVAGLGIVIIAIIYGLRPGTQVEVLPRILTRRERRLWVAVYVLATLGLCVVFLIVDPDFGSHRLAGVSSVAVALLRALAPASLGVSLMLMGYLHRKQHSE